MKQYINAVELFNLIASADFDMEVYNKSLDGVALAFQNLDADTQNLIKLSCNAEIHEAIWKL